MVQKYTGSLFLGGMLAFLALLPNSVIGQDVSYPDTKCTLNQTCDGYNAPSDNCDKDVNCQGVASSQTFSVCRTIPKAGPCLTNKMVYGTTICPGLCDSQAGKTCNFEAKGCKP